MSSSYRSSRLGLSHWEVYVMHRGGCLELYHCNMVEWSWWDSNLIWKTIWFLSVLWHCWFGHITCKYRPRYDLYCVWWDVKPCSINQSELWCFSGGKWGDHQNCSVLYCVLKLCTVICLEVKREYYQNSSVLGCVTQCSQSAAHSYEQFLQVQQIGFVTLGPLSHA